MVHGTKLWISMEYLDGGSVLDLVKKEILKEKHIAIIIREVLLGLAFLSAERKIHRDIKGIWDHFPCQHCRYVDAYYNHVGVDTAANILLSTEGLVKLGDFGASRQLTDTVAKCNTFVGSVHSLCPPS
jgi:serine/threonine-protein kinase 24/25/MST4